MAKILGLDLGINSLGWAIVEQYREENKETFELKEKGVVIFSEGVKSEKGNEISRAAERTEFRGVRRLKFRRKLRKFETLLVLSKNGMCPLSEDEVIAWRKSGFKNYPTNEDFLNWLKTDNQGEIDNPKDRKLRKSAIKNPYYFRDKASREKIDKLDLGRAFYHLAQRRGFLSNRLDQSDKGAIEEHQPKIYEIIEESKKITELTISIDEFFKDLDILDKKAKDLNEGDKKLKKLYNTFKKRLKENIDFKVTKEKIKENLYKKENLGAVSKGIDDLNEKIKNGNFKTLGQYFYSIYGNSNQRIRNQYTAREEHYLEEFEHICKVQDLGEIDESKNEPNKKYKGLTLDLYKAIFYQRPLKSQKGLVGKCTLEPTKYRCPVSRPEFEEFRMYQYLNNFKIKTPEDEKLRILTPEEKGKVKPLFYRKKMSFNFEDIVKKLIPKHETAVYFKNKDAKTAKYVVNYSLNTSLSNCPTIAHFRTVFGKDWKNLKYSYKTIDKKGEEKTRTVTYQDIWHVWATFTTNEKLYDFAFTKLGLTEKQATQFSKVTLKKDYAQLSLKAINSMLPYLEEGLIYSHAVFMANMKNVVKEQNWNNEDDRKLIQSEIKKIIDEHQTKNKLLFVINGYIKNEIENSYSKEADSIFREQLEASFELEFGKKKWKELNVNNLFEDNYAVFVKKFKSKEFLKIKRIDEKVIDFLSDNDLLSDKTKLYHPSDIEKFKLEKAKNKDGIEFEVLGSPLSNSIKNPMAMKSLHKVRKLINTLILEEKIDDQTKIHIELARELNDANKRKAIQKWQKEKEDERINYRKAIKELYKEDYEPTETDLDKFKMMLEQREDGKIVSKEDVLKYKLWKEQRHICLYTGKTINLTSFLGKNPDYDIEHTIPRSVSIDDSQLNKTLCEKDFNRNIKKNQIPFQLNNHAEIMSRISHWKEKYEKLDIEIKGLVRASKTAADKEAKDRIIQKRHYLKMEFNYWKGKYNRFELEEIKAGFKNSQIVDIGIITKYAQQYLKSYFKRVYSVKGTMVDQFKQAWGIKKTVKDENGIDKKDRSNHIHHCEDAITIACMTKNKYDILAHAWRLEEKYSVKEKIKELTKHKPWKTFSEDVKNIQNEVLIVHSHKDKVPIQSKKKLRKRGKIQYRTSYKKDTNGKHLKDENKNKIIENYHYLRDINNKKVPVLGKKNSTDPDFILHKFKTDNSREIHYEVLNANNKVVENDKTISIEYREYVVSKKTKEIIYQRQPIYLQGDTVRGSLHKDTFYGAILEQNQEKGFNKDKDGNGIIKYVVRKPLDGIKKSDVEKIVDASVKEIIKKAIENKILVAKKDVYTIGTDQTIWMNEEKQIPIRKVRVKVRLENPLKDFKKHSIKDESKHPHKREYYVQNDENYCMAIYEGKDKRGKLERTYELIKNIDAGEFYKLSNNKPRKNKEILLIPPKHLETNYSLIQQQNKPLIIKKGISAILLKSNEEKVDWNDKDWILNRLYNIKGIDDDGIKLNYHQEARTTTDVIKFMNGVINQQKFNDAILEISDLEKIQVFKHKFNDSSIKKDILFKELNVEIDNEYKTNNILDKKGNIKKSKIKESKLSTPKGGDVIENHKQFPYIKFKVSGFNALLENIDFKITPTGKIIKL